MPSLKIWIIHLTLTALVLASKFLGAQNTNTLRLARLFSDNMVIQQGIKTPVWGYAGGGEKLSVQLGSHTVKCVAGADGKWEALLPALKKGGPYELIVTGSQTLKVKNVLIGEVWLASGQSNMEFTMDWPVMNAEQEISLAGKYPQVREFHVNKDVSSKPLTDLTAGEWKVCNAENVKHFSAVAYFFARKLSTEQHVAVGILNSSYGGTPAEAWISEQSLRRLPAFVSELNKITSTHPAWRPMQHASDSLYHQLDSSAFNSTAGLKLHVTTLAYSDEAWKKTQYPLSSKKLQLAGNALIWYRKHFDAPASFRGADLKLILGRVRMKAVIYINGTEIGKSSESDNLQLTIKPGIVKGGANVLSIRLLSLYTYGLIGNPEDTPSLHVIQSKQSSVSLGGEWLYNNQIEPRFPDLESYASKPTALYNAMINPLVPYGIKGVIWYQGEANASKPENYTALLTSLIQDWRTKWNQKNLPFLYVQLPNFADGSTWPEMREAQEKVLALDHTGMVVSLDVGDANNIHPTNKKPVGERLYLTALKVAYGSDKHFEGPHYRKISFQGSRCEIAIEGNDGSVKTSENLPLQGFELAGEDKKFHIAKALIQGRDIVVSSSEVAKPVAVRFGYSPNPIVNLYDSKGLLLAPFRSDTWAN